jgi:H+/Na+-translocating ferredoxin:NAD+ oxidoreductase subunit E
MEDLMRGVWRENPVLVQILGLCPTLAVTNSVANSVAMAAATFFVLVGSSFFVSLLKRFVPTEVRIATYVLIIATFVTVADMILEATVPGIHKALGAFVGLIIVNCIILARQEAFASRNPVGRSVLDAIGTGVGFTIAMLVMGSIRELLGAGTFLGVHVFGPHFEPWVIFSLPPGGFLTLGFILLFLSWTQRRREIRARIREWPEGVAERKAA